MFLLFRLYFRYNFYIYDKVGAHKAGILLVKSATAHHGLPLILPMVIPTLSAVPIAIRLKCIALILAGYYSQEQKQNHMNQMAEICLT